MKCGTKLWLENIPELFCNINLIPMCGMSLASQMNAITRLVILIFFILLLLNFRYSILFLLLSLLFIIIMYYIQKGQMEHFSSEKYTPNRKYYCNASCKQEPSKCRFCNDTVPIASNEFISANQKLAGPANPRTKIPPLVTPPIADLDFWKANNLVIHSHINDESNVDVYQSGFISPLCCETQHRVPPRTCKNDRVDMPVYNNMTRQKTNNLQKEIKEDYTTFPYDILPEQAGQVNTACGYNPDQLFTSGLPTNLAAGNCEKDPVLKQYNQNMFMQTIQPGVYTTNQIVEPINANIGISFDQQFPPLTKTENKYGTIYTEHDPRIIEPASCVKEDDSEDITMANIYDPRFSGYGTSYRAYTDENIGQTRFFYDDINSVRMPNYITRSKIDFLPSADAYGPIKEGDAFGNKFTPDIRSIANDAFMNDTIQHRTELQERLLRKRNSEMWQLRKAPINTNSQRMLGGLGSCK